MFKFYQKYLNKTKRQKKVIMVVLVRFLIASEKAGGKRNSLATLLNFLNKRCLSEAVQ